MVMELSQTSLSKKMKTSHLL
jgi:hypothetical protein